ncbi:phage tail tape measure protein, partial [Aduncisulcus paluster]
ETFALREIDEKYNAEKLRKQAEFNQAYAAEFIDPYLLEQKAVRNQAREFLKAGNKEIQVEKWKNSQLEKLKKDHTEKIKEENKKRLEEEKKAAREQLLAHGTFFDGIALGYEDMLENQQTWAERGVDIFNGFATSAKSAFSDLGFDAAMGKMKSFSDYWESFWQGMTRSVMNHASDLLVNKGLDAL